jgi:hypothetical protein
LNRFYRFHADGTHNLIAQSVIYPPIFLNVKVIRLAGKAPAQDADPSQGWYDDRIEVFIDAENDKTTSTDDKRFGWISHYANMYIKAK